MSRVIGIDLGTTYSLVAFVDPRCPHCRRLTGQLPRLSERYRFRLVPLPVLGPESEAAVVRLACLAEQDPSAAHDALLAETVEGRALPVYRGDAVNSVEPTHEARAADPQRLVSCYFYSAATLNHVRALIDGGFADPDDPAGGRVHFFRGGGFQEADLVEIA